MQRFLQQSLKFQINSFLIFLFVITVILIFGFSQSLSSMQFQYIKNNKREYFLSMERSIMESDIYFINICLLQYENIIKFFNSEIYHYNNNETILLDFYQRVKIPKHIIEKKIHIFNNYSELNDYPVYNETSSEDKKKIYIYCALNDSNSCQIITDLISANSLSNLNQNKGIRNFKIPFYGNLHLMEEYIILLKDFKTFFSINNTKIKEILNQYKSIDNIINQAYSIVENDYLYHLKFFNEYSDNKVKLMDLMYNKTYSIFEEYNSLNNTLEKEKYIKAQSIYFQSLDYENDMIFFSNSWNKSESNIIGKNRIISNYLSWILFNISKKIDIITLPINNSTKKLISKNLCYYFIVKQLYNLIIKTEYTFDKDLLDKIYNKIQSNNITDINDCKLYKYYEDISEQINIRNELFDYYNLENIYETYLYKLIKSDSSSLIYEMKSTFPNVECLKLFYPNFFTFHQLDFYSYTLGANLSRIISSSDGFYDNVNYLIIIIMWFFWLIMTLIFVILLLIIIPKITNPIVRLTQIVNLNINDFKNENIFEYKLDDDINKFFSLCKNLIDGEMINNDLKLNEILEDKSLDDSNNNNMIINNKMILELIENQKCLNNNDKDIFLLKEGNINDKKMKTIRSPKIKNKNFNGINNLDVIKLISLNSGENSEKNSLTSQKDKLDNDDLYSQANEDLESNNLKLYEDLIKIADYVFYGKEKEKLNKMRKNIDKSSSFSKKSKPESNLKIIKGFNNITYYWYITEKANRNIRRYTNIYS